MDQIHTTVICSWMDFIPRNPRNLIHHENFYAYGRAFELTCAYTHTHAQAHMCTKAHRWDTREWGSVIHIDIDKVIVSFRDTVLQENQICTG